MNSAHSRDPAVDAADRDGQTVALAATLQDLSCQMRKRSWGLLRECWRFVLAVSLVAGSSGWRALGVEQPKPISEELKYEEPKYLTGAIYAADHKQLLFNFKRVANRSGSALKVQRDFISPDGKLAARERVVYAGDTLSSYELEESQIGASGSAKIRLPANNPTEGRIEFEYTRKAGSRAKVRAEALQENTLIADMVGPFLASHWDALQRGERVKCRYIVVPRAETVGFAFFKDSEALRGAEKVLIVRMEPTSPFVAALVDPLLFTVRSATPHRVLEYVGRTTPKIQAGGKWKDLDAVTVFNWESVP